MMTPGLLAILLIAFGVVLLFAELMLPTAGVLGILGAICIVGALVSSFYVNRYVGMVVTIGTILVTPVIWIAVLNVWPKTPVGRKMVLQHVTPAPAPDVVDVGQIGVAVSQLRPMGECEFADQQRIPCASEHGFIEPGTRVKVVALTREHPIVRIAT